MKWFLTEALPWFCLLWFGGWYALILWAITVGLGYLAYVEFGPFGTLIIPLFMTTLAAACAFGEKTIRKG